jgi:hypothetical protein
MKMLWFALLSAALCPKPAVSASVCIRHRLSGALEIAARPN